MNKLLTALLLAQFGALAHAQSVSATAAATGSAGARAAAFQCGGVGSDDQQRMKAEAARHGLLLTFATTTGAYLADVDVQISQGNQVVLQGRCTGPLMLVDLAPPGQYEIRAVSQGREQRKTVTVGGAPAQVAFTWPGS
ncbi:MAG TPA: carboxypeptidase regulatory-like domain-containing protein [Ramlibacter sp.]|nr:carboxypeptidase regulatory-like domain-containing protein [Ramlibacter sp.]